MPRAVTVCVMYIRYPNRDEPLCGFVGSIKEAQSIDQLLRSSPGGMIGTWEDFDNITIDSPNQLLYGVFTGDTGPEYNSQSHDPICYGVFTDKADAEEAAKPRTKADLQSHLRKSILPFRLGWMNKRYFPNGTPWPPDTHPHTTPHEMLNTLENRTTSNSAPFA